MKNSLLMVKVIKEITRDILRGDTEAVEELLSFCPKENLIHFLPEEEWKYYEDDQYFKLLNTGFDEAAQREQIEINAGEHGKILIFQDDDKLGFIIDVYGQNDHHSTLPVWEEDLIQAEESYAPENFSLVEIEDFVDEYAQTHDEICAALGYDEDDDGSSEMIMGDGYKWFERYQKWLPKCSSMYSEREQAIMDYLLVTYC